MNTFVSRHKKKVVALISICMGFMLPFCYVFTSLEPFLHMLNEWVRLDFILLLFCVLLGVILGKESNERFVLALIGIVGAMGAYWLFWLGLFFKSAGQFLDYYRHYPW